jgi:hypothetical protein
MKRRKAPKLTPSVFVGSASVMTATVSFIPGSVKSQLTQELYGLFPENTQAERRLLAAVMTSAIADLRGSTLGSSTEENGKANQAKAYNWFDFDGMLSGNPNYQDNIGIPFSFSWICDHLDLDPVITAKAIYKNLFMH